MEAEKLTKLFQMAGAALALPAAAAGAYTVYRSHFSPDIACQNLRASIVSTMEKNVGAEAKRALLRKDVAEFEKACGEIDPEARAFFQAALDSENSRGAPGAGDAKPAAPKSAETKPAETRPSVPATPPSPVTAAPSTAMPVTTSPHVSTPMPAPPAVAAPAPAVTASPAPQPIPAAPSAVPAPAPAAVSSAATSAAPAALPRPVLPAPATASPPPAPAPATAMAPVRTAAPAQSALPKTLPTAPAPAAKMAARDAKPAAATGERRGWVTLAQRLGPRRGEINFDGYPIRPGNPPPPGTTLTARWAVPVWNDVADSARDITAAQTVLKPGNCVRVLATRPGLDRIWAEVVAAKCGP